jgi:hypothetical protein
VVGPTGSAPSSGPLRERGVRGTVADHVRLSGDRTGALPAADAVPLLVALGGK